VSSGAGFGSLMVSDECEGCCCWLLFGCIKALWGCTKGQQASKPQRVCVKRLPIGKCCL
jgi:hypothetical protein